VYAACGAIANEDKRLLIEKDLYGGLENLVYQLKAIATRFTHASDFTLPGFRKALEEAFVHFPVYRTYINEEGADERDRQVIAWTMEKARASLPSHAHEIDFIERMLLAQSIPAFSKEEKRNALEFAMRLQQFTSPLMAKGIEDTFLYAYNRLVSVNDVGINPDHMGYSPGEFHAFNRQRLAAWPHTMNATSTHDTKRGEDARARIDVISELPQEWEAKTAEWRSASSRFKRRRNALEIPDGNDEYFLYQTLIGAWPFDEAGLPEFRERMREYLVKAVREAKVHTVWVKPDREYEEGYLDFLERLLDPESGRDFLASFRPFQRKVAWYGMWNGLSQTLLKIASPGIPDFYQGTEMWDLNLVDPDNRRPVDYGLRMAALREIREREGADPEGLLRDLLGTPQDGRCKLYLIARALKARASQPSVFQYGEYLPLTAEGERKDSVVAFARTFGSHWVIAAAPRFLAGFVPEGRPPLGRELWGDTRLRLPGDAPLHWRDAIGGAEVSSEHGGLALADAFGRFPGALLEGRN
jgi:(1->4)-alpha-D-glucan 1-alpha-D-glucosylmutase